MAYFTVLGCIDTGVVVVSIGQTQAGREHNPAPGSISGNELAGRSGLNRRNRIRGNQLEGGQGVIVHWRHNQIGADRSLVGFDYRYHISTDAAVNGTDTDAVIGDTEVVGTTNEAAILRALDGIVNSRIHALDHGAELHIRTEAGLIAVGRDDPESFALLKRSIEGTDACAARGGVDDVRTGVELSQGEFLALIRVLEVIRVSDSDLDIRVHALGTGNIADLVAHNWWDADATNEADLACLAHLSGQRTSQEGTFLLAEEEVGNIVSLDCRVDQRKLGIRILGSDFGERIGEEEPYANADITTLGGIGQVAHVVSSGLALEDVEGDAELILSTQTTLVGHIIEALIADTGGIGNQGGDDCILRGNADATQHGGGSHGNATGDDELASVQTAGKHCIVAPVMGVQGTVTRTRRSFPKDTREEHPDSNKSITFLANHWRRCGRAFQSEHSEQLMAGNMSDNGSHTNNMNALHDDANSVVSTDAGLADFLPIVQAAHTLLLQGEGVIDDTATTAILRAIDTSRTYQIPASARPWSCESILEQRIEAALPSEIAGAAALGRTRTETIATALRMLWRAQLVAMAGNALLARSALVELAQAHTVTIMGAFVDRKIAAPTSLGHFLGGAIGALESAWPRTIVAIDGIDRSPFGAGLIVGEVFTADRSSAATLLGFREPIENTLDAAGSIEDLIQAPETIAAHAAIVRRLVDELLLWIRTDPTSFFIDERWESVPELSHPGHSVAERLEEVRNLASRTERVAQSTVSALRDLPYGPISLAWNPIAEGMNESLLLGRSVLGFGAAAIREALIVNRAYLANRAGRLYSTAADLATFLMDDQGLNPAAAQRIAGLAVARLKEQSLEASQITPDIIDAGAVMVIGQELKVEMETLGRYIAPRRYIERRDVLGSPKSDRTRAWLEHVEQRLRTHREEITTRQDRWQRAIAEINLHLANSAESTEN